MINYTYFISMLKYIEILFQGETDLIKNKYVNEKSNLTELLSIEGRVNQIYNSCLGGQSDFLI